MIREIKISEIKEVNKLLKEFNYEITEDNFDNEFYNTWLFIDKEIKGVMVFQKIYDRVEIEYIKVDSKFRKQGIGSKFIEKLLKLNINNITLEVRKSNECAIEFYKKNGFEIAAIRKNYYKNEDGYLMIKKIGE